eukprot:4239980-Ditylum_brightwellii.AAC.1
MHQPPHNQCFMDNQCNWQPSFMMGSMHRIASFVSHQICVVRISKYLLGLKEHPSRTTNVSQTTCVTGNHPS